MITKHLRTAWFGLWCALWCLYAPSLASPSTPPAETKPKHPRQLFLEAEKAFQKGQMTAFAQLKNQLRHYPLYPYLEYAELSKRIGTLSLFEYQRFVHAYPDSPLTEQLQTQFLQTTAQQKRWSDFLASYQPSNNETLQCQYLNAQLQQNEHRHLVLSKISPLWLSGKTPPSACEALFTLWENSDYRTHALTWQKIKLSVEANNFSLAKRLTRHLKRSEIALVDLWIWVQQNPHVIVKKHYFNSSHPAMLEILVSGISLIAKTQPEQAIQLWHTISKQHRFNDRHWGTVVRAIGLSFAQKRHPKAEKWLHSVPEAHLNEAVHEAIIRLALAKEDWPLVLHRVRKLPSKMADTEHWLYWRARALEKVGKTLDSQVLFSKLSEKRSYYGLLSAQKLNQQVELHHKKRVLPQSFLQHIAKNTGVLRVQELNALGRTQKAKLEWRKITQRMGDEGKHAAAMLALRWNLPNLAILALSNTEDNHDLSLRFPMAHSKAIFSTARAEGLDPAWILAVTRQESAFVTNAQSHAGAMGLMQLMPTTAKMVAKHKKIPLKNKVDLLHAETNIRLGSSYLKMMLEEHKNPVLAIAAYNAGPGRIRQWLPANTLPADNWIEIIPIRETREYVKNVLTYTVIYQQLLGQTPKLTHHMPMVLGKGG